MGCTPLSVNGCMKILANTRWWVGKKQYKSSVTQVQNAKFRLLLTLNEFRHKDALALQKKLWRSKPYI